MKSRRALYLATSMVLAPAGLALGQTTYYVSPTGSDSNSGTSPSSPWQSLNKVDATSFAPGSQILFQDGGNWYGQQLVPDSAGTASQPITYGSYGTGANPTFWGSVIVPSTSFQPVYDEANTYYLPTTTTVNSFLVNHTFTNNASLVSGVTTDAGNISYVESTANTNYYDPNNSKELNGATLGPGLYINTGGALSASNVYTTPIIQSVINDYGEGNLIFKNINVSESAAYNGGYNINIENSPNVQVMNLTVTAGGKHAVGDIDSTGFLGENITASYMMPDQGYGGSSAFVTYADTGVSNTNAQWINDTFTNPNGEYPAFITHEINSTSDSAPIANVLVQNMVSDSYPDMSIYTSGNETVNITGGQATGGGVELAGDNTTVKGMLLTGPYSTIDVGAGGTGNVIENNVLNGAVPNWTSGHNGAITDAGQGTIIRYNTIALSPSTSQFGAAIGILNNNTGTQIYGNIIDTPYAAYLQSVAGTPEINAYDNLYAGTTNPQVVFVNNVGLNTPVADWPTTINANNLYATDPGFVDSADGNFSLEPNSIAAYVFDPTDDEYVMYDYYNNVRPALLDSLGAIQITSASLTWNDASGNGKWDNNTSANFNSGSGNTVYTNQSTVLFDDSNNGNYSVTLNSSVTPGRIVVDNSDGNYTIGGSGSIGGTGSVMKLGTATATLSTANTYSGGTIIAAGKLIAGAHNALGDGPVSVQGGTLALANNTGTALMTSLSIFNNGTIDIGNNAILLSYGSGPDPIASIAAWIIAGYAGGAWNGQGIMSTAAQSNSSYGIGYADSADPGNPAGLSAGTIEIMYTLLGDANLDGKVNGADFTLLSTNFNDAVTAGWDRGDFNYSDNVNGSDFILLSENFNHYANQSSIAADDLAALDAFAAANGLPINVPEPMTAAMSLLGLGLLHRRRRGR